MPQFLSFLLVRLSPNVMRGAAYRSCGAVGTAVEAALVMRGWLSAAQETSWAGLQRPIPGDSQSSWAGLKRPTPGALSCGVQPIVFSFSTASPMLRVGAWICDNVALFCISQIPLFSFSVPPPPFQEPAVQPQGVESITWAQGCDG